MRSKGIREDNMPITKDTGSLFAVFYRGKSRMRLAILLFRRNLQAHHIAGTSSMDIDDSARQIIAFNNLLPQQQYYILFDGAQAR